jgi:hypothetical protein
MWVLFNHTVAPDDIWWEILHMLLEHGKMPLAQRTHVLFALCGEIFIFEGLSYTPILFAQYA